MLMKISDKDFNLLSGMVEFHFKFSEYIRENNSDLFFRAVDYAKTFATANGIKFDYWHEDNKRFLEELNVLLNKRKTNFEKLSDKVGGEEAKNIWMKKKNTNKDDVLGMNNYIDNFVRHARELNYDEFDDNDWSNFIAITKYVKNDQKFIDFAKLQTIRVLGSTNKFIEELNND